MLSDRHIMYKEINSILSSDKKYMAGNAISKSFGRDKIEF